MHEEKKARLAALLRQAADSHHVFEQTTMPEGHTDPDWPEWYAEWLLDRGVDVDT